MLQHCHRLRSAHIIKRGLAPKRSALAVFLLVFTLVQPGRAQVIPGSGDLDIGFARHLYQQGEFRLAADEFTRFVQTYPEDPASEEASFLAADCWVQLEEWQRANQMLQAFLRRYPVSPWTGAATLRLAATLFELGRFADAEQRYLDVAEMGGNEAPEALYWAGEAAFWRGDLPGAVALLDRAAVALGQGEVQVWALRRKAQALEDLGDTAEAEEAYGELAVSEHALPEDLLAQSRLLLTLQRPREAEAVLANLRARWSGWMQSHRTAELEARALWDQGKRDDAVSVLMRRPAESPRLLAWMLLELGRPEQAGTVLLPVIGAMEGTSRSEAVLLLARSLREQNSFSSAESLLAVETAAIRGPRLRARALLQRGELLMALERFDDAAVWIEQGLPFMVDDQDSSKCLLLLAELAAEQGEWDDARIAFETAAGLSTVEGQRALLYRALVASYRGGRWVEVHQLAERISAGAEDTLSAQAAYWAGEAASRESRWEEAAGLYEKALSLQDDGEARAMTLYGLGWVYLSQNVLEEATEAFQKAIDAFPQSELAVRARLRMGDVYMLRGMHQLAAQQYRAASRAVASGSIGEDATLKLGRALAYAGDVDAAISTLEELFQSAPTGDLADDALFEKGEVLFRAGRFSAAEEAYTRVVDLHRDRELRDNALYRTADCRYNIGDYPAALKIYLTLVKVYPDSELWAQAVQGALWAALQQGEAQTALTLCDSLLGRATDDEHRNVLRLAKADLLYGLERYQEALGVYIELDDRPDAALRAAWCLQKMERTDQAFRTFQRVAQQWPDSPTAPEATYQAAKLAHGSGRLKEAAGLLEHLLETYPTSDLGDVAQYDLGLLLLEAGALPSAEKQWAQLMQRGKEPWRGKATLRFAEMYLEAGTPDSALQLVEPLLGGSSSEHGAEAHWLAAEAQLSKGMIQDARKLFLRLSYLYPESDLSGPAARRAEELAGGEPEAMP